MSTITIPNLDETVVRQLKRMASEEGVPLEESLRRLLVRTAHMRQPRPLDAVFPAPTD
jgi:hypothetical protein